MSVQPYSSEFHNIDTNYLVADCPSRIVQTRADKHNVLHKGYEELFEISIFASTVLSVLNAGHGRNSSISSLRKCLMFAPADTKHIQLIAERSCNALQDEVSTDVFKNVLTQLSGAREVLSRCFKIKCRAQDLGNEKYKVLKNVWRNLATQLLICFYELQSIDPSIEHTHLAKHQSSLEALLVSVRAGDRPCTSNGDPIYPSWIKRRRSSRQVCSIAATVLHRGREFSVVVRDVSMSGCRLSVGANFKVGDNIRLSIPRGIQIKCLVVRTTDESLGVVFDENLTVSQRAAA